MTRYPGGYRCGRAQSVLFTHFVEYGVESGKRGIADIRALYEAVLERRPCLRSNLQNTMTKNVLLYLIRSVVLSLRIVLLLRRELNQL